MKNRPKKRHGGSRRRWKGALRRRVDTRPDAKHTRWAHFANRLEERHGIIMTIDEIAELERKLDLQWDGETHVMIGGKFVKVGFRDGTLVTALY